MSSQSALAVQVNTVRTWLQSQEVEIARALPKGMSADRFCRIALTQVLRNPNLAKCDRASFVLALMESAALGLEPDSVSGLAYLIPYGTRCQLVVGYLGMIQLAHRHPKVRSISAEAVYEKDQFGLVYGLHPKLEHRPSFGPGGRGALTGVYAWALLAGGGRPFVYLTRDEIEERRSRSKAKDSGPWITDYEPMAKKTAMRQLRKWLPLSPELMQVLASEDGPEDERPLAPLETDDTTVGELMDAIAGEGASDE